MFSQIYSSLLIQPLLNLLVGLYNLLWGDIGLAIVAVTIIIRLLLYLPFKHQLESQKRLGELQPKIKEIQERYKNDKEQQSRAMMDFYKQNKVNPFGSCLPLIIQLVILFALFQVFQTGLNGGALNNLYPFINNPGQINTISFGLLDLSKGNLYLAIFAGILQFIQSKQMLGLQPKTSSAPGGQADMSQMMAKQMMYIFPLMTVFIGASLPAGLAVYWAITTLFAIGQQYVIMRNKLQAAAK
jgi:YidC/Oxa1 family membrane protein insertase